MGGTMGGSEVPATASEDPELELVTARDLDDMHFFGLPIDLWAQAQVGKIMVFYTAGKVIFACGPGWRDVAWDVATDLYLPDGLMLNHGTDYLYCERCEREFFYFVL